MTKHRSDPRFDPESPCPCGRPAALVECCWPRLAGRLPAPTAEALMRSRYTAYVLEHAEYLLLSWHPDTRPDALDFDEPLKWTGLQIEFTEAGGENDSEGTVTYVARYKLGGRARKIREKSRFTRVDGRWVYVDGDIDD